MRHIVAFDAVAWRDGGKSATQVILRRCVKLTQRFDEFQ